MAPVSSGRQAGPSSTTSALDVVAASLRCTTCRGPLHRDGGRLTCSFGHVFDIARHGYANLIGGHRRHKGDDARMVAARERFLGAGHYRPLSSTIAVLAAEYAPVREGLVVDLAGGTGHYLSAVLDACPRRYGLCVDASTPALRRAARAHPRAAAIGADVWETLPVRTGGAGVVLSVFAPRNVAEIERILVPDGIVVVARPRSAHLQELGRLVGAIGIDPHKPERLAAALRHFERLSVQPVTWRIALRHEDLHAITAMGPSAHHLADDQLARAIARLPELVGVTVDVEVAAYRMIGERVTRTSSDPGGRSRSKID